MHVEIRSLGFENSSALTPSAAHSVFWALPCDDNNVPVFSEDPEFDKQIWLQRVLMEWGICGFTAFVGTGEPGTRMQPAGTVFFAPVAYLPGSVALPTSPISPDAILLSTVHLNDAYMGLYIEHKLIDAVLTEAQRRGVKAVEVFARDEDELDALLEESGDDWDQDDWGQDKCTQDDWVHESCAQDPCSHIERSTDKARVEEATAGPSIRTAHPADAVDLLAGLTSVSNSDEPGYFPEAYRGWEEPRPLHTGDERQDQLSRAPMLSVDIVEEAGFEKVADDPLYPRYRREIPQSGGLFSENADDRFREAFPEWEPRTVIGGSKFQRHGERPGVWRRPDAWGLLRDYHERRELRP